MNKWYTCKRDIVVTIGVTVLAFFFGVSHYNIPYKLIDSLHPYVLLLVEWGYFSAITFIVIEASSVHLEHYWSWSVITIFSTTGARYLGQIIFDKGITSMYDIVWMTVVNGVFYSTLLVPVIVGVFLIRRTIERRRYF